MEGGREGGREGGGEGRNKREGGGERRKSYLLTAQNSMMIFSSTNVLFYNTR